MDRIVRLIFTGREDLPVTGQAQAAGLQRGVTVAAFVMDPIEPGAVSQNTQPAVQTWFNRPGGQINGPPFVVERVAGRRV